MHNTVHVTVSVLLVMCDDATMVSTHNFVCLLMNAYYMGATLPAGGL